MPSDQKIVRRGGVFAPLIAGPEEAPPRPSVPVQAGFPFVLLRGVGTFGRTVIDQVAQPDPGWRQPLIVYGSPPPIPGGQTIRGQRIIDEIAQPDPGWRKWNPVYGSPAPPPAGQATFGRRLLDEPPPSPWQLQTTVVTGPGWTTIPFRGVGFHGAMVRDLPPAASIAILEAAVIYGTPARPITGIVWRTDWSRDGSSEPYPEPQAETYGPDNEIFQDIQDRLIALNVFAVDGVDFGSPAEVLSRSSRQYPCAAIQWTRFNEPSRFDFGDKIRSVGFSITLIVREEEPRRRHQILSMLSAKTQNAIDGVSLADKTFRAMTQLNSGIYQPNPNHPEQRLVLNGTFTYEVVGYDARDESEPAY